MASSGSFGGGLNPFGTGSLSNLGQYDIGENLAELELYKVEVRWGNGQATDDEYLAALQKAVDVTSVGTRARETAQNRIDDATYRIGRSKAEEKGLDALIAFDQAALAKMNPNNVRFRQVKEALDSGLSQRRSRDYGDLVRRYNDGEISTEKLVQWVDKTLGGLDKDDPDFRSWTETRADLGDRLQSEKDAKVYQDYQQDRMEPEAFLAYLTDRRDSYDTSSPQWDDWSRRLEDAQDRVKSEAQAAADTAFFNRYEEGKESDASYLTYLRTRIQGMDSDDPDLATWKHRLNQAAFSLAEDQLRFDVEKGTKPASALVSFYKNYRATLNPGSAEYRQISRALLSLGSGGGSGGSGGGGGGGGGGGVGNAVGPGPKLIDPKYSLSNIVPLLTINVGASKGSVAAATKALELNIQSVDDARKRGDAVWLFHDPRTPGGMVAALNPDGTPVLDAKGKPVMVPGSAYLPVTDEAFTNLLSLKANLHYSLAGKALASNDAKGYFYQLRLALGIEDRIRVTDAQVIERSNRQVYDMAQDGIDLAMRVGDWATAINLAREVQMRLDQELANPMLDDTRRDRLEKLSEKLAENPLLPQIDPLTGKRVGGAVDLMASAVDANGNFTSVVLNPGWHQVLDDADEAGVGKWQLKFDENQDGSWEATHIGVQTTFGGQVVSGEVTLREAPINPTVLVRTSEGSLRTDSTAQYIRYVDEHGQMVKAYSLDGQTWIRSMTGAPPMVELNANLVQTSDDQGTHYVDPATGEKVFTQAPDGSFVRNSAYFSAHPEALQWYGQGQVADRLREAAPRAGEIAMVDPTTGRYTAYDPTDSAAEEKARSRFPKRRVTDSSGRVHSGQEMIDVESRREAGPLELGGPGQSMQLITVGPDGSINLTPPRAQQWKGIDFQPKELPPNIRYLGPHIDNSGPGTTKLKAAPKNLGAAAGGDRRGYDGMVRPPVAAQLPPGTPPRWDGESMVRPSAPPAKLAPKPAAAIGLGARLGAAVVPPKLTPPKPSAPVVKKKGTTVKRAAPKPAPKPPARLVRGNVPRVVL